MGMRVVPPGFFQMGSPLGFGNEAPEHPVLLDGFYLDQSEVSNRQYRACVDAGGCPRGRLTASRTRAGYRDDPRFDDYPVVGVTWADAGLYCRWAGKRLPSEAEWEFAAGGPDNLAWPWGNEFDKGLLAARARDTEPVDSHHKGASPFGILNLAGNVGEWVADVYALDFYAQSPAYNPLSGGAGYFRIHRGGSFGSSDRLSFTTSRRSIVPRTAYGDDIGFRCAWSIPAEATSLSSAPDPALISRFCEVYAAYRPGVNCP